MHEDLHAQPVLNCCCATQIYSDALLCPLLLPLALDMPFFIGGPAGRGEELGAAEWTVPLRASVVCARCYSDCLYIVM
jgi:hypothetical protein